jgi:putative ubiquitin-RnfH superfamily antitoxin RatB of RatAB toxin-antitoxin module
MSPQGCGKGECRNAQHDSGPASTATVTVVFASPRAQEVIAVTLATPATVADALRHSGLVEVYGLDCDRMGCAVDGHRARLSTPVADGSRVDLARALDVEPGERRRLRAQATPAVPAPRPPRARRSDSDLR